MLFGGSKIAQATGTHHVAHGYPGIAGYCRRRPKETLESGPGSSGHRPTMFGASARVQFLRASLRRLLQWILTRRFKHTHVTYLTIVTLLSLLLPLTASALTYPLTWRWS